MVQSRRVTVLGRYTLMLLLCCTLWGLPDSSLAATGSMVLVEGGTVDMGDTFGDGDSNERPIGPVTAGSFYISKYEVTFEEYDAFCEDTGRAKPDDNGWGRGRRPVGGIRYINDVFKYCNWRSEQEGLQPVYSDQGYKGVFCNFSANGYRLPTEVEWEYAARGGKNSAGYKFSGSNNVEDVAWYKDNAEGMTHPVGEKLPNELGLYDMNGNAPEICWGDYEEYVNAPVGDWFPPARSGTKYIIRGGSWQSKDKYVRISQRGWVNTIFVCRAGIRLVRAAEQ